MTIHFPDVSHYQNGLKLTGAVAVIVKATEGDGFTDFAYPGFQAQARDLGVPFVAYHWVNNQPIEAQARHAYNVVGPVPLMWDAEAGGSSVPRLVELTRVYRDLGGVVNLVYLPRWWWRDHLGMPDLRPLAEVGLSLISSAYPATGYSETGVGWQPYGGMTPVQWQYTSSYPFNGYKVDFNAFKGTVAQWWAIAAKGGDDMQLSDVVPAAGTPDHPNRTVEEILADLWGDTHTPHGLYGFMAEMRGQMAALTEKVNQIAAVPTGTVDPDVLRAAVRAEVRAALAEFGAGAAAAVG